MSARTARRERAGAGRANGACGAAQGSGALGPRHADIETAALSRAARRCPWKEAMPSVDGPLEEHLTFKRPSGIAGGAAGCSMSGMTRAKERLI